MSRVPTYSDDALASAVSAARSWRGVLRAVGLTATSSSAIRSVRHHADRLGLDYSHFTGQRRWTDAGLAEAVREARSWSQVAHSLGLTGGSSESTLKGHALRLGLDVTHLAARPPDRLPAATEMRTDPQHLPRAGSLLAAAWFALCGHDVSWPLEPCRYDLVTGSAGGFLRVQVKTTTVRAGQTWIVWLSSTRTGRVTYDPDEIDYFFVIDGDLTYYLIPVAAVGGLHGIHLSAYEKYTVDPSGSAAPGWVTAEPNGDPNLG